MNEYNEENKTLVPLIGLYRDDNDNQYHVIMANFDPEELTCQFVSAEPTGTTDMGEAEERFKLAVINEGVFGR